MRWRLLRGGDPSATRGVEVGNERRVGAAGVVAAAELNDSALPVTALAEEFVDLVVEVVEAVLTETLVLDLGDLGTDLAKDLRAPALGVGEVAALGGEVGQALSGLARGVRGAGAVRLQREGAAGGAVYTRISRRSARDAR